MPVHVPVLNLLPSMMSPEMLHTDDNNLAA